MKEAMQECCSDSCKFLANYIAGMGWDLIESPTLAVTFYAFSEIAIPPQVLLYSMFALKVIKIMQFAQNIYQYKEGDIKKREMMFVSLECIAFLTGIAIDDYSFNHHLPSSPEANQNFLLTIGFIIGGLGIKVVNAGLKLIFDTPRHYISQMINILLASAQGVLLGVTMYEENIDPKDANFNLVACAGLSGFKFLKDSIFVCRDPQASETVESKNSEESSNRYQSLV